MVCGVVVVWCGVVCGFHLIIIPTLVSTSTLTRVWHVATKTPDLEERIHQSSRWKQQNKLSRVGLELDPGRCLIQNLDLQVLDYLIFVFFVFLISSSYAKILGGKLIRTREFPQSWSKTKDRETSWVCSATLEFDYRFGWVEV